MVVPNIPYLIQYFLIPSIIFLLLIESLYTITFSFITVLKLQSVNDHLINLRYYFNLTLFYLISLFLLFLLFYNTLSSRNFTHILKESSPYTIFKK